MGTFGHDHAGEIIPTRDHRQAAESVRQQRSDLVGVSGVVEDDQ